MACPSQSGPTEHTNSICTVLCTIAAQLWLPTFYTTAVAMYDPTVHELWMWHNFKHNRWWLRASEHSIIGKIRSILCLSLASCLASYPAVPAFFFACRKKKRYRFFTVSKKNWDGWVRGYLMPYLRQKQLCLLVNIADFFPSQMGREPGNEAVYNIHVY